LDGGRIWWIVPSYPIASEVWRDLCRAIGDVATKKSEVERRIELPGGGSVTVKSADNPDSLRGAALDGVVIDEAAFCDEDVWFKAVPPTIADRLGWALLLSTPNGFNWFHDLFESAGSDSGWDVFQRPTSDNPIINAAELARLKREMPIAAYMQEHEARFTSVAGAEFPGEYFNEGIWCDELPGPIAAVVVAMDPSKGKNPKRSDYTAIVTAGFYDGRIYVDADLERCPVSRGVDLAVTRAIKHGATIIAYESNGFQELIGPMLDDRLAGHRFHGITIAPIENMTNKEGRIQSLDPFLRNDEVRFVRSPGSKLLVNQLKEFPMAAHDDGPDALEVAIRRCLELLQSGSFHNPTNVLDRRGY
jgi:predicted phage terminase large subunit-like protein